MFPKDAGEMANSVDPDQTEKRPHGRAVSAPDFGSRGRGFESR